MDSSGGGVKLNWRRFRSNAFPSGWHAHGGTDRTELIGAAAVCAAHDQRSYQTSGSAARPCAWRRCTEAAPCPREGQSRASVRDAGRPRSRRLHTFALVPGFARHEGRAGRQPDTAASAIGFDTAAMLEAAGSALNTIRLWPGPDGKIRRRARDEVEGRVDNCRARENRAPISARAPMPFQVSERLARPAETAWASTPTRRAVGKAPSQKQEHATDAAPKIQAMFWARFRDQAGGQVGSQEIVERGAVPIEALQESPVSGEPA